jgi:hypothetical protein
MIDASIFRTEWQNLYPQREIMVLGMGLKEGVCTKILIIDIS